MGITVDNNGNVYVADSKMRRVQKFGSRGNLLTVITGKMVYPTDVAVDQNSGNLYVLDAATHYFWEMSPTGQNLRSFGGPGVSNAQFVKPYGICTDVAGNVFVADTANSRVQKFSGQQD
jgi:DNA-binding beta-propeller fold protein YncE